HHKLGTALFLTGDAKGASEQFEEVVRLAPPGAADESASKAHYSLGVMSEETAHHRDALDHLTAAVRYQPNYVEAHVALGDALRRSHELEASLAHYDEALMINPRSSAARLGHALSLAGMGRWQQSRDWLAESTKLFPDRQEYAIALARLLAAAPDARVRD